jgi:hypothetical protein
VFTLWKDIWTQCYTGHTNRKKNSRGRKSGQVLVVLTYRTPKWFRHVLTEMTASCIFDLLGHQKQFSLNSQCHIMPETVSPFSKNKLGQLWGVKLLRYDKTRVIWKIKLALYTCSCWLLFFKSLLLYIF